MSRARSRRRCNCRYLERNEITFDCHNGGALPLPLAGEGWGEGVSAMGQSPRGDSPHPALCADLSRKRER
ncbi:hypothetical protein EAS61_05965 [Bradyrhizobium zhanjiangense]|uniref:Uncharacterized protein n=1 Tax=Bradyrhizobium zhanjiangense TaxID=1325107 RepID=A0A4Q0QWE9_9BRAD|nr:hypothetical protein EAS61_05965 [Bradyrhizobium zhanjiangense]